MAVEKPRVQLEIERRIFTTDDLVVEQRQGEGEAAESTVLTGHAAVFNSLSENFGGWREKIAPGAFVKSLNRKDDVRALFNHDPNFVLGRTRAKTLRLSEDEKGLAIEIDAPTTQLVRDLVLAPIARRDITQMSFAFIVENDAWEKSENDDFWTRTLHEVRLFDVSPVTYPAYPKTDIKIAERAFKEVLDKQSMLVSGATRKRQLELYRQRWRFVV